MTVDGQWDEVWYLVVTADSSCPTGHIALYPCGRHGWQLHHCDNTHTRHNTATCMHTSKQKQHTLLPSPLLTMHFQGVTGPRAKRCNPTTAASLTIDVQPAKAYDTSTWCVCMCVCVCVHVCVCVCDEYCVAIRSYSLTHTHNMCTHSVSSSHGQHTCTHPTYQH